MNLHQVFSGTAEAGRLTQILYLRLHNMWNSSICIVASFFLALLFFGGNRAFAQIPADLSVNFSASLFTKFLPAVIAPGGHPTEYGYTVWNFGPNPSYGGVLMDFYLSRDTIIGNADDIWLGQRRDISSNFFPGSAAINVSAPNGIAALTVPTSAFGTYFVYMKVTPYPTPGLYDPNLSNNFGFLSDPVTHNFVTIYVGVPTDTTAPTVSSIIRWNPSGQVTSASNVTWLVTFSEPVTNVSVDDFTLVDLSGGIHNEVLTSVNIGGGSQIQVNAYIGQPSDGGAGDLRLDVLSSTATIMDLAGNSLDQSFTNGQIFTVDHVPPVVTAVTAVAPDPRNTPVSSVEVTFSEPIFTLSFDYRDIILTRNGVSVPLTNIVATSFLSGSTFRITNLDSFTTAPGAYVLTVIPTVTDLLNNVNGSGTGSASDSWTTVLPADFIIYVDAAYAGINPNGTLTDPFRTVTDAVNAAQNGNTIRIFSGNYPEVLTTEKLLQVERVTAPSGVVIIGQ